MSSESKEVDARQARIERRMDDLAEIQEANTLVLAVALSESDRILTLVKLFRQKVGTSQYGDADIRYLSKIEIAAKRIISEIHSTNVRSEPVAEVSDGMALRQQDSSELPDSDPHRTP